MTSCFQIIVWIKAYSRALGCSHAIFSVRKIIQRFTKAGYTANLCSIDLSKVFGKVNHSCLFLKLMNRCIPVELLQCLENFLSECNACVMYGDYKTDIRFALVQGMLLW